MRIAFSAAAWLNAVMILLGLCVLAVPTMAPAIAADLGVGTELVGLYTALLWSASVATSVAAGALIRRHGALRVSQACLGAAAAGALLGSAGTLPFLAAAAMMIGLGQGAETPASSALLVRITPPRQRTLVISIKQTGGQIGGIFAGLLFPALAGWIGWRGALFVMMPAMLLLAAMLERVRHTLEPAPEPLSGHRMQFREALRLILSDGRLLRLALSCMVYIGVQVCQQAFLVAYLVADCSLSLATAGTLLAIAQAGGLLGRVLWGALAGRVLSAIPVLVATGVGMAACAILLGTLAAQLSLPMLGALCFCFGLTSAGWVGVHIAETARLVPSHAVGQITGAMLVVGVAGLVLGPMAFAALAAATSFSLSYAATGAAGLLGALVLMLPARADRPA